MKGLHVLYLTVNQLPGYIKLSFSFLTTFVLMSLVFHIPSLTQVKSNQSFALTPSALSDDESKQLSENLANILWMNLSRYSPHYDIKIVLETIEELSRGKREVSSFQETYTTILPYLDKIEAYEANININQANHSIALIAKKDNVVEVQKGKIYYEQIVAGTGPTITMQSAPSIHFIERTQDRVIRNTRDSNFPIKVQLSDTLRGFALGVQGMRVGERRMIYVHPDLAYGQDSMEDVQQMIIFDVEIISE